MAFVEVNELLMPDEKISSSKGLPTSIPAAGKGLLFGMCPFMSLDMFNASESLATVLARQCLGLLIAVFTHIGEAKGAGLAWRWKTGRPLEGLEGKHYEKQRIATGRTSIRIVSRDGVAAKVTRQDRTIRLYRFGGGLDGVGEWARSKDGN